MKHSNKLIATGLAGALLASTITIAVASDGRGDDDEALLVNQATLTMEQAGVIALTEIPGKVSEAEIENEDGKLVWEVEVVNSQNVAYELTIDANTGEVLEKEQDD